VAGAQAREVTRRVTLLYDLEVPILCDRTTDRSISVFCHLQTNRRRTCAGLLRSPTVHSACSQVVPCTISTQENPPSWLLALTKGSECMSNWTNDDDPPAGCSRGGWGPNFCQCASCAEEERQQKQREERENAAYRARGIDPNRQVMPLMLGVDLTTYERLLKLASVRGMELEHFTEQVLERAMNEAHRRGLV